MSNANMAQMLAQRMMSPGAMAEFGDRTGNPDAQAQVGDGQTGSSVQEPGGMDNVAAAASMGGPAIDGNAGKGKPGDAGLGLLSSAHDSAKGKKKAEYKKALDHAHKKHHHKK